MTGLCVHTCTYARVYVCRCAHTCVCGGLGQTGKAPMAHVCFPSSLIAVPRVCVESGGRPRLTFVGIQTSYCHTPSEEGGQSDEYSLPFMHQKKKNVISVFPVPGLKTTQLVPPPLTSQLPEAGLLPDGPVTDPSPPAPREPGSLSVAPSPLRESPLQCSDWQCADRSSFSESTSQLLSVPAVEDIDLPDDWLSPSSNDTK